MGGPVSYGVVAHSGFPIIANVSQGDPKCIVSVSKLGGALESQGSLVASAGQCSHSVHVGSGKKRRKSNDPEIAGDIAAKDLRTPGHTIDGWPENHGTTASALTYEKF